MNYHLTGIISTVFFMLCLLGLVVQLRFIWRRKKDTAIERPTAVISLNQFASSYLAFYAFFVYGFCLERFNHYLVWSRLFACLLVILILFEVFKDRRDRRSLLLFGGASLLFVVAVSLMAFDLKLAVANQQLMQVLIMMITPVLAQGYFHQAKEIRKLGNTGGVSLPMHQLSFAKDLSTIAFSLTMGVTAGWPVLLLSGVSALAKLPVFFAFYRIRSAEK
jgi:hypothetical protein